MRLNTNMVKDQYRKLNGGKPYIENGVERYTIAGSKLGMKIHKSKTRALARIHRFEQQGIRISESMIRATGMPLTTPRKVYNAKRKKFLGLV